MTVAIRPICRRATHAERNASSPASSASLERFDEHLHDAIAPEAESEHDVLRRRRIVGHDARHAGRHDFACPRSSHVVLEAAAADHAGAAASRRPSACARLGGGRPSRELSRPWPSPAAIPRPGERCPQVPRWPGSFSWSSCSAPHGRAREEGQVAEALAGELGVGVGDRGRDRAARRARHSRSSARRCR